jgi:hypothetical protein
VDDSNQQAGNRQAPVIVIHVEGTMKMNLKYHDTAAFKTMICGANLEGITTGILIAPPSEEIPKMARVLEN